ncbi:GNAT family N-acetyltransferase [bacterium]|nr:GNAT family N-acetyltransferase [bacterium]
MSQYLIEPLDKHHNRTEFSCGIEELDVYVHRYAGQDIRKQVAAVFVLLRENQSTIAGYYTLSATGIRHENLPDDIMRKLPKYPITPATLLGRLAVDRKFRGEGLGETLLLDALYRSLQHSREIASMAVIVNAINNKAKTFYEHYGFQCFPDTDDKLFLPMKKIQKLFPE